MLSIDAAIGVTPPTRVLSTDVLVVGAGAAGLAAALAAARAGARVIVLETSGSVGGNAMWATGFLAFCDTELQRSRGVIDSVECFLGDARAEVAREGAHQAAVLDEGLFRQYCEESDRAYRTMRELGFEFGRFVSRPGLHTVDRLHAVDNIDQFGVLYRTALEDLHVEVRLNTRASRLVLGDDGQVAGALADAVTGEHDPRRPRGSWSPDSGYLVRAGATILTAGGYQASAHLRVLHQQPRYVDVPHQGLTTCEGDAHLMGQAVGGAVMNMHVVPRLVQVGSGLVQDAVAVNVDGVRFHDEPGSYESRVVAVEAQPQGRGFYVCDARAAREHRRIIGHMPGLQVEADTLPELADKIGCSPSGLERTVADWNQLLAEGRDDEEFGRQLLPRGRRGIVEPPFVALEMVVGVGFTAGGFQVDEDLGVIDPYGERVSGLYAAGDCLGGVNVAGGLGGTHIASAVALGQVAGERAWAHIAA